MQYTACIDIPAMPLQLLLRDRPQWAGRPAAVVDRDKPSGRILWANEAARARGIVPGMRYAGGLALAQALCGGVVEPEWIARETAALTQRLQRFSPRVEPAAHEPGVFWLDASGMRHLFASLEAWARAIRLELRQEGFDANAAAGFSRFGVYAAAKDGAQGKVFRNPVEEQAWVRAVSIARLGIEPELIEKLHKLGIETVGGFLDLPCDGIRTRFGPEAYALYQLAQGACWAPLQPSPFVEPVRRKQTLDYPEAARDRLLALLEPLLADMLRQLAARHERAAGLVLRLELAGGEEREERVAPAAPTSSAAQLMHLLGLRLETIRLPAGVEALELRAISAPISEHQLELAGAPVLRNLDAIHRAFAKLRAELGNEAVARARLCEAHLPEAGFGWEPMDTLPCPQPVEVPWRPLVRRLHTPPIELPPRPRSEPDGWLVAGCAEGPVDEVIGPHLVSGGWWAREVARTYYYVRTRNGRWLWIYHDDKRRRWYLQGEIE